MANEQPLYKNPKAPVEQRVEDLLSRMTLEEKGQQLNMLNNTWGDGKAFLKDGKFDAETFRKESGENGQGSLHQREDAASPRDYAASTNATQKFLIENSRLGIPALFITETLHGMVGPVGTTIFPHAINLGMTWDPELLEKVGEVIGIETRATGNHVGLSPVLDICREPRWGRLEETYGEDPYLVSRLGVAMVKGMQGEGPEYKRIIATLKHFAGHGVPQGGRDSAPVGFGREFLREFALPSFEAAVREAKAGSVMAAYSDWCYTPCSASHELLTEILREEWGFQGFVIEDMGAIMLLRNSHSVAKDHQEAGYLAVKAGVDQSFVGPLGGPAVEYVKRGILPEEVLNNAVRRVLRAKFLLGLFENPYHDEDEAEKVCDTPKHRALARQAACQSIVLLKNENNLLPLRKDLKSIAVIGPNAAKMELGDYTGRNENIVTPLQGIQKKLGKKVKVHYAEGCTILGNVAGKPAVINTKFLTPKGTTRGIAPQPGSTGLMAEYFTNTNLEGDPIETKTDAVVAFNWGNNGPLWGKPVQARNFSVRWTGVIVPEVADTYEISVNATDGVRLYLDDQLVIDSWRDGVRQARSVEVALKADEPRPIVLEYYNKTTDAEVQLLWTGSGKTQDKGISDAVKIAKKAEVAVVFIGGSGALSGEIRDAGDLELTGQQMDLIKAVYATKTPVVLVHIGGRPNTMEWAFDHIPAAIAAWNPGMEGGNAIADVLFGDFTPCAKLSTQWPSATGQLPSTYDYMHTGRNERGGYVNAPINPRFPFGHGLSYTKFEYSNIKVDEKVQNGQNVTVSVDLQNVGEREGTEVAQLYVRDMVGSIKRPMRQLKGFERVTLQPGEKKTVTFTLTPQHLSLWNAKGERVVEPGEFKAMVGSSAATVLEAIFTVE